MRRVTLLLLLNCVYPHFIFCQQNKLDSLEKVLITEKEDTNRVNTLNQIAYLYTIQPSQDYRKALIVTEAARQLSDKISYKRGAYAAYRNLGTIYGYFGIYEKALESFINELKISERLNDSLFIIQAYKDMSSIYYLLGNYKQSLAEAQNIEKMAKISGDKKQIAFALSYEAKIYTDLCKQAIKKHDSNSANLNYAMAIKCVLFGLTVTTELKDSIGIGFFYNNLGFIYDKCNLITDASLIKGTNLIKANFYRRALESDLNSLKIFENLNDSLRIIDSYANLALFYRNQGDLLHESGKLSLSKSNYEISLDYFLKILAIIKKLGFKHGIANYSKEVGVAYLKLGEFNNAQKYISAGAKGFDEIGFKDGAKECYEKLSEVEYNKGNYRNAFEDYKKFSAIKDFMMNEAKSKQLIEINVKYETQKKEDSLSQQQKLIAIKNRSIKQQNYFLIGVAALALIIAGFFIVSRLQSKKISNQYKEIVQLQSELTHRTGNFFNSIKGMLSVALHTTSDKETIASIDKRVNTINHLFKTLYSSQNDQYVTFTKLLNSICDDFEHSFGNEKNIHIYRETNAAVSKEEAVPLAFIITELLTNAYKHAFKNTSSCEIHVEVYEKETARILHTWDNGEGLSDTINNTSQGMSIIKSYCKTIGGKMSSWNDNGFHFKMEF